MSVEDNQAVVVRRFTDFWGSVVAPVDELAAPDGQEVGLDDGVTVLQLLGLIAGV